jgi:hypothetical protein
MLNSQQVAEMQNSAPTNWASVDAGLTARSDGDINRFADDNKLHVRFYMKPRLNMDKSNEAQRPIYEDTVYVEIMMPGEKNSIIQRPAWEQDFQRFHALYEKFLAGEEQIVGTPLAILPFLTPAQVEELSFFKVRTVEQLAELNDGVVGRMMGARDMKTKAAEWLASINSGAELRKEIEALKLRNAALEKQISKR